MADNNLLLPNIGPALPSCFEQLIIITERNESAEQFVRVRASRSQMELIKYINCSLYLPSSPTPTPRPGSPAPPITFLPNRRLVTSTELPAEEGKY